MQNPKQILDIIKERNLNVLEIARNSGIPSSRIYKWLDGKGQPKLEDSEKLLKWAKKNLDNVPRAPQEDGIGITMEEEEHTYKKTEPNQSKDSGILTLQALVNLTESNKQLAESNHSLSRSHERLVNMVQKSTGDGQSEIPVSVSAKIADFLELIAELGTGKKIWKSKEEALAVLSKFVPVPGGQGEAVGTHHGSDKRSRKA